MITSFVLQASLVDMPGRAILVIASQKGVQVGFVLYVSVVTLQGHDNIVRLLCVYDQVLFVFGA